MAISHVKSNLIPDWTGTVTVFGSDSATKTVDATQLVQPRDWNSLHAVAQTLAGNTSISSALSGYNIIFSGGPNVTLVGSGSTIGFSAPNPVVTAGLISGINVSGGASSQSLSGITFSNSNGVSFGLSSGVLTASVAASQSAFQLSNSNNVSFGTNGSTVTASASFSQSVQTQGSVAVLGSTGNISFSNANGVSFGAAGSTITASHNGLTTAALSNHSHGNPSLALTNLSGTTASNSAGLTLSLSAAPPGAGAAISAGTNSQATGTVAFSNSNGVSFGLNTNGVLTASITPAGGAQTGLSGLSAGTTQITSGTVSFANSNGVSFGVNGNTVTASHNGLTSQTVQTQGSVLVQGSSGAISFSNSNGITFGFNASTITASHNGLTTAAQSNHSHGNPTLALTNLSGTTASASNGLTLSLSAAAPVAQTAQTVGLYGSSQTFGQSSSSTVDARSVTFVGQGGVSVGLSAGSFLISGQTTTPQTAFVLSNSNNVSFGTNGSTVTASASFNQSVQTQNSVLVQGSSGAISFSNSNGITFGFNASTITASHNGLTTAALSNHSHGNPTLALTNLSGTTASASNGLTLSLSAASQTVQTQSNVQGLAAGTQTGRTGDIAFANSNGISFGMSGSSQVTASYTVPSTAGLLSAVNVSAGTTSQNLSALTFANGSGVTFGMAGSVITASVAAVAGAQTGLSGISAGTTQVTSGTVSFANSNGVSFGVNGNTLTASHNGLTTAALSNHSHGDPTLALTNLSGTTASNSAGLTLSISASAQSAFVLSNSNNVSFGTNGSTVTASATFAQSAQTQSNVQGISAGTQVGRTGDISFANSNGISFGMSGSNTVTASYTVPSTAGLLSAINVSAGTTSQNLSALTFANGSGVTFGMAGSVITASVAAVAGAQTGLSGISAGTTQITSGTVSFADANGISFGANGNTLTASHNGLTTAALSNHSHGNPTLALTNVSGTTASNSAGLTLSLSVASVPAQTEYVFSNSNSVSFGTNGSTVTASFSQSVQTQALFMLSNTYGQSSSSTFGRTSSFVGSGGVSVGLSNGSILISGQTTTPQTVQTQGSVLVQGSSGAISFSNSNGITFGFNASTITASHNGLTTAALSNHSHGNPTLALTNLSGTTASASNGLTLSISAAAPVAQTVQTVGLYGSSQTYGQSSSSTADARSLSFVGQGGVSVGLSGGSFLISGQTTAPQTAFVLSNSNNVSFGTNGSTVTASASFAQSVQTQSNVQGISAGTQVGRTGDISFANSNGISFGMSGSNTVTASYTVPSTAGLLSAINVSAGTTSNNLSAITFSNGSGVTFGMAGSVITASVAAVAGAQTGLSGISAGTTQITSGTVSFANANGVSFGANGNTLTASHNGLTTAALSNHSHGDPTLALTNLSGTTASNSAGLTLSLSAAAQSVQPGVGAVAFANTTFTSGTVAFSNANGISFGSSAGQVTASYTVPTQTAFVLSNSNNVSFGTNGSTVTASASFAQTVQTQGSVLVQGSSGAISFSNSNGITFGFNASTITASHNGLTTAAASNHSHGNPTLALTNLSGTTASASNGLTLSISAAAPVAQTAQTIGLYGSSQTYGQSSSSTVDARSLSFVGQGGVSVGLSAGSLLISGQTTTPQTAFVLSNSNNVSFGTNGSTVTASASFAQSVQPGVETLAFGNTTFTNGAVSFSNANGFSFGSSGGQVTASYTVPTQTAFVLSNSNNVSFGTNGSTVTASATFAQSAQTVGVYGSSQTYGQSSSSSLDARSLSFVGQGGVSVGLSGGSILLSGQTTAAQTSFVLSNSNNVSFGTNGSTVTASATFAQSVQTQGVSAVAFANTTFTSGAVSFSNANGISFGSSGAQVTASYTVPTVTNSAWTVSDAATSGTVARLAFTNLNGITLSLSTGAAGSHTIVGSHNALTTAALSNHSHGNPTLALTNLSGTTASASNGLTLSISAAAQTAFVLSNSNNVSFGTNGSTVTASASFAQTAQTQSNVQGIIAGTQSGRTGDISFANSNGISFGMSGSNTVTASYTVPSTVGLISAINVSAGTTSNNLTAVTFSNSNGVSFGMNGSVVTASVAGAGGAQTGISGISAGTTQMTSGTASFANSNGISFGVNGNTITASHNGITSSPPQSVLSNSNNVSFGSAGSTITASASFSQSVQTQSNVQGISAGTQVGRSGDLVFSNSNGISFGMSGSSRITASFDPINFGISNLGNTAGTSGTFDGAGLQYVLIGGANITLSQSSNGSSVSLSIIGGAGGGGGGAAISAGANSQSTGTVNFSNSNNISFGLSNNGVMTGSVNAGVTGIGNSQTTYSTGVVAFSEGGGAITIASTTGQAFRVSVPATSSLSATGQVSISTNGSTISIGVPNPGTDSGFSPYADRMLLAAQMGNGSLFFDPLGADNFQFDRALFMLSLTNATNSTMSATLNFAVGLYSRTASSLSLVGSTSTAIPITLSGTVGNYSLYSGMRQVSIPWTRTVTEGQYWLGCVSSSSSAGANVSSISQMVVSNAAGNFLGQFGASHNTTMQVTLGQGIYTANTSQMPGSLAFSQIRGSDSNALRPVAISFASGTV